jgi:hypothetical protein
LQAPVLTPYVFVAALAWSLLAFEVPSLYAQSSTKRHGRFLKILACP